MDSGDYDARTALHLAAVEGQLLTVVAPCPVSPLILPLLTPQSPLNHPLVTPQ